MIIMDGPYLQETCKIYMDKDFQQQVSKHIGYRPSVQTYYLNLSLNHPPVVRNG